MERAISKPIETEKDNIMDNLIKQEMTEMKKDLQEVKEQTAEMYRELIGNSKFDNRGLVGRLNLMEQRINKLESRADDQDDKIIKFSLYEKLLYAGAGVTATGIISYLIEVIFKK